MIEITPELLAAIGGACTALGAVTPRIVRSIRRPNTRAEDRLSKLEGEIRRDLKRELDEERSRRIEAEQRCARLEERCLALEQRVEALAELIARLRGRLGELSA